MFKRGYKRGGLFVLFLISILGVFAQGVTSSTRIGITNLNTIPGNLVDTVQYNLTFHVVNHDVVNPIANPISIYMKVDGGEMIPLITNYIPFTPVAPGDSQAISVNNFNFRPQFFSGGGITHDIIVWPMSVGAQHTDSADKNVQYEFTEENRIHALAVTSPLDLPGHINAGQAYNFQVTVINQDPARNLVAPVKLMMSIDNDTPSILVDAVSPSAPIGPGEIMEINVPNYIFDAARFNGGGITHDIIVWPMAAYVQQVDSGELSVTFDNNTVESITETTASTIGVEPVGGNIMIHWSTRFERSGMYFEIDKKTEAGSYNSIFVIEGNGTGEEGSFYQVVDEFPVSGLNTYRMSIRFNDGSRYFVKEFSTQWEDIYGPVPSLTLMANPFNGHLRFAITVPYASGKSGVNGRMEVYNLEGKPVYRNQAPIQPGATEKNIDLTYKPEGIYFYRISIGEKVFTGKVMKE